MREDSSTLTLIDASPYIFRAYFSLPSTMKSGDGEAVNAVYGFATFLLKLLEEEAPSHLAAAFDGSLTTSFRNDLYPAYKAQRELPPAELEAQLARCREMAEALGVATFIDHRYEADDIVGALWRQHRDEAVPVVIVSSDKDLTQLVDEGTVLYDFGKGERYDAAAVEGKLGVRPRQVPDYLGLAGDSVDNIPGVAGVGAKTAAALLAHFTDLDDLFARLDEVSELPIRGAKTLAAKLAEHREQALLSRRLATVAVDAPFSARLEELEHRGADPDLLDPLLDRLGFGGRLRRRVRRWC